MILSLTEKSRTFSEILGDQIRTKKLRKGLRERSYQEKGKNTREKAAQYSREEDTPTWERESVVNRPYYFSNSIYPVLLIFLMIFGPI